MSDPLGARVALVTGARGQDGSYLVERLVADGYAVHGLVRPEDHAVSVLPTEVRLHEFDLTDPPERLAALVRGIAPDEVYNLAGISSVARSWEEPTLTAQVCGTAAVTLLEVCLRIQEEKGREIRFLQASSAEVFGQPQRAPQDESTPLRPVSPYGAAKAFAHMSVGAMRHHGLFAVSCVLYNHESPRRSTTFVTRKITAAVAEIARGSNAPLPLGNLDARRDWGWAPDYVDGMVRALRHDRPDDYVLATGEAHSVRDFVVAAFAAVGIDDWESHVRVDQDLFRPADPALLVGAADRARDALGWAPTVTFTELIARMVAHDLQISR